MGDLLLRMRSLIAKELLTILKDRANRLILVGPALIQSLLFGYAATFDLANVPYALLDESRSPTSAALVASLEGTGVFRRVATLDSPSGIRALVDRGGALMVLCIGPGFERDVAAGRTARIEVILDARNSTTAGSAAGYVSSIVQRFASGLQPGGGVGGIAVETRAWYNPDLQSRWNLMPGMIAALSLIQTLLLTALSVAREREQGTFDQLLVTPLSPLEIMVGKALPSIMVGLVQSTLVLLITRFWFGIPMQGSVLALYAGLAIFLTAAVGIGLAISAFAATMQQAMMYTFVVVMPMMLLSGLMTPVDAMPALLQAATYANPLRFGVDISRRIYLEGASLLTVGTDFIPLVVTALVTLPTAAWLFRHRLA